MKTASPRWERGGYTVPWHRNERLPSSVALGTAGRSLRQTLAVVTRLIVAPLVFRGVMEEVAEDRLTIGSVLLRVKNVRVPCFVGCP